MLNSDKDKQLFFELQALSKSLTASTFKEVFETFITYIILESLSNNPIYIPGLGDIKITYSGDERKGEFRVPVIESSIDFNNYFKAIIGKIEDGELSDIHAILLKKINNDLAVNKGIK